MITINERQGKILEEQQNRISQMEGTVPRQSYGFREVSHANQIPKFGGTPQEDIDEWLFAV